MDKNKQAQYMIRRIGGTTYKVQKKSLSVKVGKRQWRIKFYE